MSQRIRRVMSVLVMCAASTAVITVSQAQPASAAILSVSIETGGSIGNMGIDALYNGVHAGGDYASYSRWDANGNLTRMARNAEPTTSPIPSSTIGPISGEMSIAPMTTAVLLSTSPMVAMPIASRSWSQ